MKCPECGGDGVITFSKMDKNGYFNDAFFMKECSVCHGTGEVQTNEEWFCQLPTEQKARWLYDHYVNARADEYYGRQEKTLSEYQKWLVSVHRGIDGTKIDLSVVKTTTP